jgi:PTH1 family peptidyl-tRNA hydrolase
LGDLYIIVGLGNPGREYEGTRHNTGFEVVDVISERLGIKVARLKHKALIGEGFLGDSRVILVKPQTYMNLSGESVREIVSWYKTPLSNLIIVYDDIDLPLGSVRVRAKGSSGTHNGMKSVIYQLQSDQFPRIRIGIGHPKQQDLISYVLGRFTSEERAVIEESVRHGADAAEAVVKDGINSAMNIYNRKEAAEEEE